MQHIQDNSVNSTTYDKAMRTFQHSNLSDRIDRSNGCQIRHTLKKKEMLFLVIQTKLYIMQRSTLQKALTKKTSKPVKHNTVT